jgi:hypothetical protein
LVVPRAAVVHAHEPLTLEMGRGAEPTAVRASRRARFRALLSVRTLERGLGGAGIIAVFLGLPLNTEAATRKIACALRTRRAAAATNPKE